MTEKDLEGIQIYETIPCLTLSASAIRKKRRIILRTIRKHVNTKPAPPNPLSQAVRTLPAPHPIRPLFPPLTSFICIMKKPAKRLNQGVKLGNVLISFNIVIENRRYQIANQRSIMVYVIKTKKCC